MEEDNIELYMHKDIEISYRIDYDTEDCIYDFKPFKNGHKVCFIELIQNTSEDFGNGEGSEALAFFLKDFKKQGFTNFYLFASYDKSYYKEDNGLDGLTRLINFYSKFGFQPLGSANSENDQIDMYLDTRSI